MHYPLLDLMKSCATAASAQRYAQAQGATGMEFDRFGRRLGRRALLRGRSWGARFLLKPVACIRYWEFPFAWSALPEVPGDCLDVSSSNLFSFYVAQHRPARILMMNPDAKDVDFSRRVVEALHIPNITLQHSGVEALRKPEEEARFDCIWSISVIEHIAGEMDDRDAVRLMYKALKPGGRLILTVPVDRDFHDTYRKSDPYGTQPKSESGRYFFQRNYTPKEIEERLIDSIGREPSIMRWHGEKEPGRFWEYHERWITEGFLLTANDPREMADHYREYASWEEMPGFGTCGLVFDKP